MSLSPAGRPQPSPGDGIPADSSPLSAKPTAQSSRLWTVCFILLALEAGAFLSVFPWIDAWHINHFRSFSPFVTAFWDDPYFRGAVTGLGVTNLLVALGQSIHLIRSLRKPRY